MSRTLGISLVVAFAVGVLLAPGLARAWQEHQALRWIVDDDPERRAAGWLVILPDGAPPTDERLADVSTRLADGSDAALLDGAAALTHVGRWGWTHEPRALVLRHLHACAASVDDAQHRRVLDGLATAPLDLDREDIEALLAALQTNGPPDIEDAAYDAVATWAGPHRLDILARYPPHDVTTRRRWMLIQSWGEPVPPPPPSPPTHDVDGQTAWLVHHLAHDPRDLNVLNQFLEGRSVSSERPPIADLLRLAGTPEAATILQMRADSGDVGAKFAQQAMSTARDAEVAVKVAADRTRPRDERRLALWRLPDPPESIVREILALPTADPDGSVLAATLIAERELGPEAAAEQADRWIHSMNDDEKRAGALLAALSGTNVDALERAHTIEDVGRVRTLQRLALWSLGRPVGPDDPFEFAHRVTHDEQGEFRGDAVLCRLLAGDDAAMAIVTSTPNGEWSSSVRRRTLLLERFVPTLHDAVGRPIGGTERGLRLHFDRLDALRTLLGRRIVFDPIERVYLHPPPEAADDATGSP